MVSTELSAIQTDLIAAGFAVQEFPHSLNAQMSGSDLRIQFSLDPRYQDFLEQAHTAEVLGQRVPVASLADVIRGKVWAWGDEKQRATKRKKDELDLMRILEAYPQTRSLMPEEIRKQVPE